MDNKTLAEKLAFSPEQIKKLEKAIKLSSKELNDFNDKHVQKLKALRDEMRKIQAYALINYKVLEEKFVLPVNLFRITQDYSNQKESLELKPQEIMDAIESFLSDYDNRLITSLKPTDKFMKQDDRNLKFLLEVALNEYLAPVKCIFEYGLTRKNFNDMMKEIKMSFIKAIVEPGEMVGIIAAQNVGEPTSQMSAHRETKIKFVIKNLPSNTIELKTVKIGELCDEIIKTNPGLTINTGAHLAMQDLGSERTTRLLTLLKDAPQFENILITNTQNTLAYKFDNKKKKFITVNKNDLLDDIIDERMCDLSSFYEELENDQTDISRSSSYPWWAEAKWYFCSTEKPNRCYSGRRKSSAHA